MDTEAPAVFPLPLRLFLFSFLPSRRRRLLSLSFLFPLTPSVSCVSQRACVRERFFSPLPLFSLSVCTYRLGSVPPGSVR